MTVPIALRGLDKNEIVHMYNIRYYLWQILTATYKDNYMYIPLALAI